MTTQEHKTITGHHELCCPQCSSQHIISLREELTVGAHTTYECTSKTCDCDFLVTSINIPKKIEMVE